MKKTECRDVKMAVSISLKSFARAKRVSFAKHYTKTFLTRNTSISYSILALHMQKAFTFPTKP